MYKNGPHRTGQQAISLSFMKELQYHGASDWFIRGMLSDPKIPLVVYVLDLIKQCREIAFRNVGW